jgi:DNA-binding GntR family transcriptional regulator
MARTQPAESVTNRLRQDVLRGDFEPGTRLIEAQLTERYGTGRDAIRAAILELDKEGLITREANRGATVRELTLEEAISIYEARAALEGLLAQRAAERASEADRDALRALLPEMRQAAHAGDA